jgi:hypothetical protein
MVAPGYSSGNNKSLGDELLAGDFDAAAGANSAEIVPPAMRLSAFELEFAPQRAVRLRGGQAQEALSRGAFPANSDWLDRVPPCSSRTKIHVCLLTMLKPQSCERLQQTRGKPLQFFSADNTLKHQ